MKLHACRRCRRMYQPARSGQRVCVRCRVCAACGSSELVTRDRCAACADSSRQSAPRRDAIVDLHTRYSADVAAQLFVAAFPDGATCDDVGAALGLSAQRIKQIETAAFRSLRMRLRVVGITSAQFVRREHALAGYAQGEEGAA